MQSRLLGSKKCTDSEMLLSGDEGDEAVGEKKTETGTHPACPHREYELHTAFRPVWCPRNPAAKSTQNARRDRLKSRKKAGIEVDARPGPV